MVKVLEKAGCLELRTAGYIIGWLGMAGSILIFFIAAVSLTQANQVADYVAAENGEQPGSKDSTEAALAVSLFGGILIGISVLSGVISGFLLYGIKHNRHSMLLPWLVLGTFGIVLSYIQLLGAILDFVTGSQNFLVFLYQLFCTGLQSYVYFVIYSLYSFIKMDSGIGQVLSPQPEAALPLQQNNPSYTN